MAFLTGCAQEAIPPGGTGWLSLESLSVGGRDLLRASATRGIDEGLYVKILDEEGTPLNPEPYTSANAEELRCIELKEGDYTLEAYSANHNTTYTTEAGEAKYYKAETFTIEPGKITSVQVRVPMTNYAVSLELPEGFTTHMDSHGLTLTSGEREVTIQEGDVAYFEVNEDGFTYTLAATNTENERNETTPVTYKPVESGKYYKVKYSYDSKGGIDVDIDDSMEDEDVEVPLSE